jgi:pimeloyl-ACP methyl ester carboxylesterase
MTKLPGIGRIVLVHGAAHGAWCWELLTPILTSYGYEVQTLDLPGLGDDATPPADVHLSDYVGRVVDVLRSRHAPALVLAHSMGGVPASQAAENASAQVARLVYLSAVVLKNGESMASLSLLDLPQSASQTIRPSSVAGAIEFDPAQAHDVFYNRCRPELVQRALARLRPQAAAPIGEPVTLSEQNYGQIPKSYILCTDDHALPPSAQQLLCERAGISRIRTIVSDHSPFLSAPEELADIIREEARTDAAS